MLWQKDANNIYVNLCQEDIELRVFERARESFGSEIRPTKSNDQAYKHRNAGNLFFSTNQWLDAIESYNTSLCFAEIHSEHMGLAYANRSACFLHLKMYDKCLADIRLAMQANYPQQLMPKLVRRKAVCLEQIERNGQPSVFEPELSFEADEKFSCMANVLKIQQNEEFGRHIIATSDIGVGKVILKEEAFVPSACNKYKLCDTCRKYNVNLIPCGGCTTVLFCAGPCEQNSYHRVQCGIKIVTQEFANDQQMQMLRSILMAVIEFPNTDDLMKFVEAAIGSDPREILDSMSDAKSKYRAFLKLMFDRRTTEKETFPTQILFVYKTLRNHRLIRPKFSSKQHRRFLMHLIGHHLCVIQCNTGGIVYSMISPYNISQDMSENLSIIMNYINHSCAPNVMIISFHNFNVCITLRPIKTGDQLFIFYFRNDPVKHNTVNRQTYLQDIFKFHCNCERCLTLPSPPELKEMKSDECYRYLRKYGNPMNCCARFEGNTRVLVMCSCIHTAKPDPKLVQEKCLEFLNKYGRLSWTAELGFVINCFEKSLKDQFKQKE